MLSRVLDKTKRLLTRSPSFQGESQASVTKTSDLSVEMVTSTRRGPIDQTPQSTPRSSTRKTKRPLETEETPLATKKRRGSKKTGLKEVTSQDTASEGTGQDGVPNVSTTEIRINEQTEEQGENTTTPARLSSPKVVIQKTVSPAPANTESPESAADDEERVIEESDIQDALAKQFLPTPKFPRPAQDAPAQSGKKKRGRKSKGSESNIGEGHEELAAPAVEEPAPKPDAVTEVADDEAGDEEPIKPLENSIPSPPKNIRIRFDSEEPPAAPITEEEPPAPQPAPAQTDEESDSDDEAPEEIAASTALTAARQAESAALKASKAQQQAQDAKRKARADRITLEQRQKRERLEEEARQREKQEARRAKKLAKRAKEEGLDGDEQENKLGIDLSNLPTLLPASLLDAAGDARPPTPPRLSPDADPFQQRREKLARHIKFLERGEKRAKDVKRGGVNVRVLEEQNELLASKVNHDTKNVRESWLKGRREGKGKGKSGKSAKGKMQFQRMERRAVGGGFSRGGD